MVRRIRRCVGADEMAHKGLTRMRNAAKSDK